MRERRPRLDRPFLIYLAPSQNANCVSDCLDDCLYLFWCVFHSQVSSEGILLLSVDLVQLQEAHGLDLKSPMYTLNLKKHKFLYCQVIVIAPLPRYPESRSLHFLEGVLFRLRLIAHLKFSLVLLSAGREALSHRWSALFEVHKLPLMPLPFPQLQANFRLPARFPALLFATFDQDWSKIHLFLRTTLPIPFGPLNLWANKASISI